MKSKISDFQSEDNRVNRVSSHHQIKFVLVPDSYYQKGIGKIEWDRRKKIRELYHSIVEKHHSYVAKRRHVGRHIGWLIYYNNKLIGCVGIGSYFLPEPLALTKYIGWKKEAFNKNFNQVANNWRFTLMPNAPHNIASQCLSILCKLARKEWKKKYGNNLVLLVSLVGAGHKGTCFKAAGWEQIGKTVGSTKYKSYAIKKSWKAKGFAKGGLFRKSEREKKIIFVKPLHRCWKEILNRNI